MPQNNNSKQHPGQKKKKKGRAPAHQNKFAFKHNPKSKTTDKILASPIYHVCQRCHDKLEWRKQYRKYKPRTQPGTCNGCQKRNVKAAYHTLCESCTISSPKAKALIEEEWAPMREKGVEEEDLPVLRACAVCVKEIALPDPADEADDDVLAAATGRIKLRELKTLERQLEREAAAKKASSGKEGGEEGDDDEVGDLDLDGDDLEENDPFLQAVGGAGKLLTGEAYQKQLLEQQQQVAQH